MAKARDEATATFERSDMGVTPTVTRRVLITCDLDYWPEVYSAMLDTASSLAERLGTSVRVRQTAKSAGVKSTTAAKQCYLVLRAMLEVKPGIPASPHTIARILQMAGIHAASTGAYYTALKTLTADGLVLLLSDQGAAPVIGDWVPGNRANSVQLYVANPDEIDAAVPLEDIREGLGWSQARWETVLAVCGEVRLRAGGLRTTPPAQRPEPRRGQPRARVVSAPVQSDADAWE